MDAKSLLKELNSFTDSETIHMYIIERKQRADVKTSERASVKYEYIPLQVNLSKDLKPLVIEMLSKAIEKKVKEDVEIKNYEVIDDTLDKLYTYKDLGKIEGFHDFLKNRLNNEIKALKNFAELQELEKAWALCYGFYDKKTKGWLYCIKKLAPRRMAVELNNHADISEAVKHGITSLFDLDTRTLKPLNGFALNLEPSIDMIYYKDTIYIFQKRAFEDITSLTEEFETVAQEIVDEIKAIKFVKGLEHLSTLVAAKPAFRNKLIKAKSIGNLEFLKNCGDIKREFQRAGKKLEIKFRFDDKGNVVAADEDAAENIIKVLCEYYKEGVLGGKIFESPAGRIKDSK
ncbi:MAG: Kiwa anti-phage protein KwaB-like domain-containing protein [Bacteroidota bacterium]